MKELVTTIVKSLVDDENAVQIKEVAQQDQENSHLIEVTAAKEDVGKIIGKQGNTARAIRHIMKASGKKINKKYYLAVS